jgi:hypothetical protein
MKILSFDQALDESARYKKRHLLVGNGFSIAWRREIFTYGALFERADFKNLSTRARSAFEALDTTDFEQVIRGLQTSAALAELFGVSSEVVQEMNEVAASLRELLVTTIATSHPDNPSVLDESELSTCSRFLNHFNTVYSINYDLLLYWVGMHLLDNIPMEKRRLAFDDGFRTPENGDKPDYVTWDIHKTDPQTIYYLHGTLHLFDAGYEL